MSEVKRIYHRFEDVEGFDDAVVESLEDGWLLVRCCIARYQGKNCWVAELVWGEDE